MDAYFKILKVCKSDDLSINIQMEALCELLPDYTAKVIKCFTKLTDKIKNDNIYIQAEKAKTILKAGFKSSDESVRQNAKLARDNLLSAGKLNISDFND